MINYTLITKPGIIMGNLITVALGFLLASKGVMHFGLFLGTLVGMGLIMASSCVFNNYINRASDGLMARTKERPLVTGAISAQGALLFAALLGLLGASILYTTTNLLCLIVASIGFFVYVVLYSFWKCRTIYGTAIGSVAGAVPPVIGYLAVSNSFDMGAALLFIMLVLWQMPHFFAIALSHFDDYVKAGIPVLPVMRGMLRTKIHMLLYIVGFTFTAVLLSGGWLSLICATALGLGWLVLCFRGFGCEDDQLFGKTMFRFSLVVITLLSIVLPLDIS